MVEKNPSSPPPPLTASEAATDAAAAHIVPLKRLRVDLVNLKYSPVVRDVKGKRHVKHVIHDVTTSFVPYTVSALMGPSGSGKTSLLTVVAGFVDRAHVEGDIRVSGEGGGGGGGGGGGRSGRTTTTVPKKLVGIVFQDDMMLPALTVFETIKFAADLRMSRAAAEVERRDACDAILAQLGLSHVKDALVGGAARRGGVISPTRKFVCLSTRERLYISFFNPPDVYMY